MDDPTAPSESSPSADAGVPSKAEPKTYKFFAFISYSRKDSAAAKWLQHRLEWFRFPVKLVPEERRPGHPRYIRSIYRDRTNLEVDHAHYWENLKTALEQSRYLIVLCSPNSAKSAPVDLEVRHFLDTHENRIEDLVPVILGGKVGAGEDGCLGLSLAELGETITSRNLPSMVPDEGVAMKDGWENGFIGLVSYLLSLDVSDLSDHIRREERKQVARTRMFAGLFALIACAAVAGGIIAWQQGGIAKQKQGEAEQQEAIARAQLKEASRSDFATAQQRLTEGKWQEGVAYLGRAIRFDPENSNAQDALWLAILYGRRDISVSQHILTHDAPIRSIRLSPNGLHAATASEDRTARIWNTTDGQQVGPTLQHSDIVVDVNFSPDGALVLTTSEDKAAQIWEVKNGLRLGAPLKHEAMFWPAKFSPDGHRVATASKEKSVNIFDSETRVQLTDGLDHASFVISACFSPDGSLVATSSENAAQIWDLKQKGAIVRSFKQDEEIGKVVFSPDGKRLLTVGTSAQIWNAETGEAIGLPLKHDGYIWHADFSPDGLRVVTASWDNTARIWDAESGEPVCPPLRHTDKVLDSRFSQDGSLVITASIDKLAQIWDARTGVPFGVPFRHGGSIGSANFFPDNSRIITSSADKTARIWETKNSASFGVPFCHGDSVISASWSPEDIRFITAGRDGTARIWNAETSGSHGSPLVHAAAISDVAFSPDGLRVATASDDNTARIWEVESTNPIGEPMKHDAAVINVRFISDGSRVITTSMDKTVRVWDSKSGAPVTTLLRYEGNMPVAFDQSGRYVVVAARDKVAHVWDLEAGKPVGLPCKLQSTLLSASLSRDGSCVVTLCEDGTAQIWNVLYGQRIGIGLKHHDPIVRVTLSPDGLRVITIGKDGAAQIWNAKSGMQSAQLFNSEIPFVHASFSLDNLRIVTASEDSQIRMWDSETGLPIGVPLNGHGICCFSNDGTRLIALAGLKSVRIWDIKSRMPLNGKLAGPLVAICSGAQLDSKVGSLRNETTGARMEIRKQLNSALAAAPDWHAIAMHNSINGVDGILVSPRTSISTRIAISRLFCDITENAVMEARFADPANFLLRYACANLEIQRPSNVPRAAWLCEVATIHFPFDATCDELRCAARLINNVTKKYERDDSMFGFTLPIFEIQSKKRKQAKLNTIHQHNLMVLKLLDWALKLDPSEDEDFRKLRESLRRAGN